MNKIIIAFVMFLLIAPMLSSCALLDRLRGVANPHSEILIEVPTVTEDVRE